MRAWADVVQAGDISARQRCSRASAAPRWPSPARCRRRSWPPPANSQATLNAAIIAANADHDPTATILLTGGFSIVGSFGTPTKPLTIDTQEFTLSGLHNPAGAGGSITSSRSARAPRWPVLHRATGPGRPEPRLQGRARGEVLRDLPTSGPSGSSASGRSARPSPRATIKSR